MSVERQLRVVRGPRQAEEDLWRELARELAPPAGDAPLQRLPVRVLVPSRSLVEHLGAALTRRSGRPLVGLRIETARGLARDLLANAGERATDGELALRVLAERSARQQAQLRRDLADYRDGFASVAASVRDLFDAGYRTREHGAALAEALAEAGARGDVARQRRAEALLQVAGEVEAWLAANEVFPAARLFQRATQLLAEDVEGRSRARAVFVYGFANATGAVLDFLTTLLRHPRARVWLDRPPEALGGEAAPGAEHLRRLEEALRAVPGLCTVEPAGRGESGSAARDSGCSRGASLRLWRAAGMRCEVRAVAGAIDELLRAGTRPESILVVARDLAPYARAIQRAFRAVGVPFSALSEVAGTTPFGRRAGALVELLRARDSTRVERWLDVLGRASFLSTAEQRTSRADLASGMAELGIARLGQLAEFDLIPLEGTYQRLGVPRGFVAGDARYGIAVGRRRLAHWALEAAGARARELLAHPALADQEQSVGEFVRHLRDLVRHALEWRSALGDGALWKQVLAALAPLADLRLPAADRITLLEAAFEPHLAARLGGEGGGVCVLNVTEARARTAEHLFLLGMNRGVFPRRPREDALLGDELRRGLRPVLPDLPLKLDAHEEERYLFAQLLAASPERTLSWQGESDDGKALAASSLVEQLLWQEGLDVLDVAGPDDSPAQRRTPLEALQRAGVRGSARDFEALLPILLDHVRAPARRAQLSSRRLARARSAVLRELDAQRAPAGMGPYLGGVGPVVHPLDPRRNVPYVTHLERLASCGWQRFLQGVLRLERAADPLAGLPSLEARSIGNLVHRAVESWIRTALQGGPAAGRESERAEGSGASPALDWSRLVAREVPAPTLSELEAAARQHAPRVLREDGIPFAGMIEALVRCARPYLARLVELEGWKKRAPRLCGAELSGAAQCEVAGRSVALAFRTDVVDRDGQTLRLTDLKTGAPITEVKRSSDREKAIEKSLRGGEKLQGMAYALASGGIGRYVFLKQDLARDNAVVEFSGSRKDWAATFHATVSTLLEARDAGAYLPRLVDGKLDKAPIACRFCDVASACHKDDSGYRARFVRWAETHGQESSPSSASVEERWFQLR